MMSNEKAKRAAAERALDYVEPGMVLGLGTGSTASLFVEALGARARSGLSGHDVAAIPTSEATRKQALAAGIDIIEPDETTTINLAIDGTDETDARGALIKGGGGALLREKIIAQAADKFVVIADASKKVVTLGAFPLPVEIDAYCWALTVQALGKLFATFGFDRVQLTLRSGKNGMFITDGNNLIVDCSLGAIPDPAALDAALRAIPGVIETGLFVGIANSIVIGNDDGSTEVLSV